MTLASGSRIGTYEIVSKIGAGGMGEVYRARDPRIDRTVAIKVLPDSFGQDADRIARFSREAKSLAALNHPNIASLYGFEEQGGTRALIMELVEGEDLSTIIARGPLPVPDALAIARQLVDALEAAHESGLVHRDLKPANIKVKADGTVKVLDFGLAKAVSPDGTAADAMNSPTITSRGTEMGVIVGTAAYMAPEQAKGRAVDKRADIWAFGCVLYEMLTGTRAFKGEDVSDTLAAVLRDTPDFAALPAAVPARLRALVRRTLDKNVKLRLRDIGDARVDLADAPDDAVTPPAAAGAPPSRRTALTWLAAGLVAGLAAGWSVARFTTPVPTPEHWTATRMGGAASAYYPAVSPAGDLIAFTVLADGLDQIAVMRPQSGHWTVLTTDRAHGTLEAMCWARDGSRIYFERRTDSPVGIFSVPALGGEQRLVLEDATQPVALKDGSLIVGRFNATRQMQLHRFRPSTGQVDSLAFAIPSALVLGQHRELPDGRILVFGWPLSDTSGPPRLYVMSADGSRFDLVESARSLDRVMWVSAQPGTTKIFAGVDEGSGSVVVAFDADGREAPRRLFNASTAPIGDVDADGNVYLGTLDRNIEALSIRPGARTERLGLIVAQVRNSVVVLGNGQLATSSDTGTMPRVLVASPGRDFMPLLDTDEPSRGPIAPIGAGAVAMLVGSAPDLAVVDIATGRLTHRFPAPKDITDLAASPDGRTLYYQANGTISAIPVEGGPSRVVGPGDSFTVDPSTGDLIVKLLERDAVRLARQPAAGGPQTIIPTNGAYRVTPQHLIAGAVRNGRLALSIAAADSWYWMAGTVDLATGRIEKTPNDYQSDIHYATWQPDGAMLATGLTTAFTMWKFSASR